MDTEPGAASTRRWQYVQTRKYKSSETGKRKPSDTISELSELVTVMFQKDEKCESNNDCKETSCCIIKDGNTAGQCRPSSECIPSISPENPSSFTVVETNGYSIKVKDGEISSTVGTVNHDENIHDEYDHHVNHAPQVFSPIKYKEHLDHLHTLNKKCCGGKERSTDAEGALNRHGRCCGGGAKMAYNRDESGILHFKRDTANGSDKDLHRPQRCCGGGGKRDANEEEGPQSRSKRCCGGGGANQRSTDDGLNRPSRCCGSAKSQRSEDGLNRSQRCCGGGRTERDANGAELNRPQRCCGGAHASQRSADGESISRPQVSCPHFAWFTESIPLFWMVRCNLTKWSTECNLQIFCRDVAGEACKCNKGATKMGTLTKNRKTNLGKLVDIKDVAECSKRGAAMKKNHTVLRTRGAVAAEVAAAVVMVFLKETPKMMMLIRKKEVK